MRYYKLKNINNNSVHDGFLFSEKPNVFYLIPSLNYFWSLELNDDFINENLIKKKFFKEDYIYFEFDQEVFLDDWIFNFNINDKNKLYFNQICDFFNYYLELNGHSISNRLEFAVDLTRDSIPDYIIKDLILFIISFFEFSIVIESEVIKDFISLHEKIGKFIKFSDSYSGDSHYGYLISEDERYYYVHDSFIALWCFKRNDNSYLKLCEPYKIDKFRFSFKFIDNLEPNWQHKFELEKEDFNYIRGISYFFDTFNNYSDFPFIKRLEISTRHRRFPITDRLISKMIDFIGDEFRSERLKIMFSTELSKFKKSN